MTRDVHQQAREWIATGEPLAETQQSWLQAHLRDCESCRDYAKASGQVIRSLRSVPVAAGPSLVRATQMRVRLRARELRQKQERLWLVWMSCALVGLSAALTTPLLWRGFAWIGELAQLSAPVWQTGFALFWITPVLLISILFLARGTHLSDGSAGSRS